jgi:hypothetical protein
MDKYAVFYVCEIPRSDRSTVVKTILEGHTKLGYLRKNKHCKIISSVSKRAPKIEGCPPIVIKEYRPNDKITKPADLAVIFEDGLAEIPSKWKNEYVEGRAFRRDTYQFTQNLALTTIAAANLLAFTFKERETLLKWAEPLRLVTDQLAEKLLECYGLDKKYQLDSDNACVRSLLFGGLALFDPKSSKKLDHEKLTR